MTYHKVDERFWKDEKVQQWDSDIRLLALYLLTNPHSTSEGFYQLKKMYMMADLNWDRERFDKAFDKLLENGFLKYDETVSVVFLPNSLKYNSPDNPNQAKYAIKQLQDLPDTLLIDDFLEVTEEHGKKILEILNDSTCSLDFNCLPNPSSNSSERVREGLPKHTNSNSNSNSNSKDNNPSSDQNTDDSPKFDKDSNPYQLAKQFRERIIDWHDPIPGNVPNSNDSQDLDKWSKDMDRLLRLGPVGGNEGPTRAQVAYIIRWIYDIDDFWRDTIESPHGIRKNLSKITAQIRCYRRKKEGSNKFNGKSKSEYLQQLAKSMEGGDD